MTTEQILAETKHRPWDLPGGPWVMYQRWADLMFAHWRVEAEVVRRLVPEELELDLFEGKAWVGLTPFRMAEIRGRGLPALAGGGEFFRDEFTDICAGGRAWDARGCTGAPGREAGG